MAVRHPIANNSKRQARDRTGESLGSGRTRRLTIAVYLALTAITLAVFGQTIRHEFVNFDDDLYVYDAPNIKAGLTINGILLAFTSPHARNWHPLTTISHMLDCQLWGLERRGPSPHQPSFTYNRSALAFYRASSNDRRVMEKCACRGIVRDSPTPC